MSTQNSLGFNPPAIPNIGSSTTLIQSTVTDSSGDREVETSTAVNSIVTFGAGNGATVSIPVSQTSSASSVTVTARPGSSGLSSPAKIGIGIGVPIGVAVCAAIAFLIFRYRRPKKRPEPPSLKEEKLDVDSDGRPSNSVEICDVFEEVKDEVHEIHGDDVPPYSIEAPGSQGTQRHELPA